jgi:hypothetical protein
MRSCDRLPWNLSLRMSLIMRMSMRCCGIRFGPQRARGYAPAIGSYATSASTVVRSGSNLIGHGAEIAGHVPEIIGHDAENTGHTLPKYAQNGSGVWIDLNI